MKTPEEIKKGLECCCTDKGCDECPYNERVEECFQSQLETDALAYITQLEQRLAQAERERNAAVAQLKELDCATCARMDINELSKDCRSCRNASNWQWRGVCEENSHA